MPWTRRTCKGSAPSTRSNIFFSCVQHSNVFKIWHCPTYTKRSEAGEPVDSSMICVTEEDVLANGRNLVASVYEAIRYV
jgi:hypothetical protein